MPNNATLEKVYDNLDSRTRSCVREHLSGREHPAIHKGLLDIGVKDNEIIVFSKLMDANSLFLTANADTVYFVGMLDLTKGPMVIEMPTGCARHGADAWWRWVTDFGAPGPDRGRAAST